MAHLKIATPEGSGPGFARGALASIWINGVNISQFCSKVHVDIDADGPITAQLTIFVSSLELGIDANLSVTVPDRGHVSVGAGQS
jgi:hypothetical protein